MLHKIPKAPVYDRVDYLKQAATDRVILDIGATGPMSDVLASVAKEYHSTDILPAPGRKNYYQLDLDSTREMPVIEGLQLIIAGEIIEHLSNAGHFLDLLHLYGVPIILTTPNSRSVAGLQYLARGVESVNKEHVAWYSYHTLKTLVERHRFQVFAWGWYNGQPLTAEGLVFQMRPINGTN